MNERREGALLPDPQGREGGPVRLRRVPAAASASRRVSGSAVGRVAILGGALAAVLLLLPTFPVAGLFQTMDVMILAPQHEHEVGDAVRLTIHVLRAGVHEDADPIGLYRGAIRGQDLSVVRVDTGVYESTYLIRSEDRMAGGVRIFVEAWIGEMRDQDVVDLAVGGLEVDVSAAPLTAKPGTFIDITLKVRERGVPRSADGLFLAATLTMAGAVPRTERLEWIELGVGTYMAAYRVPRTVAQDAALWLTARADVAGAIASGAVRVVVDVPAPLVVWLHTVSDELDEAVVDILAANETGWPAAGAAVALTYEYFYESGTFVGDTVVHDTDGRGVASFAINHTRATSNVHFWGTVTAGSATAGFSGSLGLPKAKFSREVEVVRDDALEAVAPVERATVHYTVLQGGVPLASQTLYYFARTRDAFVASGVVTSDGSGRFAIEFAAPAGLTTIDFSSQIGGTWVDKTDRILVAKPLSVEVGEVYVGGMARVSASLPDGSPPCIAFIEFRPYTGDWSLASGVQGVDVAVPKGNVIEHDLVVPRFLPKGQEYLLSIEAIPLDRSSADRYVHVETITIENRAPVADAVLSSAVVSIGSEVEVNASASSDRDGIVDAYEVDWGDGTTTDWSANATADHAYEEPGNYNITARVRDDDGAVGETSIGIHVEATTVDLPPISFIALALSAAAAAAAALPIAGPKVLRAFARPRRSLVERAD